jgi:hypothetical protein
MTFDARHLGVVEALEKRIITVHYHDDHGCVFLASASAARRFFGT